MVQCLYMGRTVTGVTARLASPNGNCFLFCSTPSASSRIATCLPDNRLSIFVQRKDEDANKRTDKWKKTSGFVYGWLMIQIWISWTHLILMYLKLSIIHRQSWGLSLFMEQRKMIYVIVNKILLMCSWSMLIIILGKSLHFGERYCWPRYILTSWWIFNSHTTLNFLMHRRIQAPL